MEPSWNTRSGRYIGDMLLLQWRVSINLLLCWAVVSRNRQIASLTADPRHEMQLWRVSTCLPHQATLVRGA